MERTIPEDLAVALLGPIMMPENPTDLTLIVGRYSADLPANLVPDGFASVGAVFGEWTSSNVAITKLGPEEALSAMEARLKSAGWSVRADMPGMSGGFAFRSEHSSPYCNADGTSVSVMTTPRASGGSYGRWMVTKSDCPHNPCKRTAARTRMHPMADIPMPILRTPPGVSQQRSHGSGGSDEYRVDYATAITTLSLGNLLRGYAEQVQKAGWQAHPAAIGDFAAVQTFEMTDAGGKNWRGLLAVVDNGADRAVLFRVSLAKVP